MEIVVAVAIAVPLWFILSVLNEIRDALKEKK